jgi:hypothetical protein
MSEIIVIPEEPPRNPLDFKEKIDLKKGLRAGFFYGYFFLVGIGLCILSTFFPPYEPGLIFFKVAGGSAFFGLLSYLFLSNVRRRYKSRLAAFCSGRFIEGTVARHDRVFSPWKSKRDYTVTVEFSLEGGNKLTRQIQSAREEIQRQLPLGSKVDALLDGNTRSVFIPMEIGVAIRSRKSD